MTSQWVAVQCDVTRDSVVPCQRQHPVFRAEAVDEVDLLGELQGAGVHECLSSRAGRCVHGMPLSVGWSWVCQGLCH